MNSKVRSAVSLVLLGFLATLIMLILGVFDFLIVHRIKAGKFDDQAQEMILPLAQSRKEYENEWCGVKLFQFPEDLLIYQDLVYRTKPDVIIETGTARGGLTLYLSTLLGVMHPGGKVVTVDIEGERWRHTVATLDVPAKKELLDRIVFIEGSSTSPQVVEAVSKHVRPGQRVMVLLDSAHTTDHVLAELKLYSGFVSPDCYLIVNDTHISGLDYVAPSEAPVMIALEQWLPTTDKFERDRSLERFLISCSHSGFLKRVK